MRALIAGAAVAAAATGVWLVLLAGGGLDAADAGQARTAAMLCGAVTLAMLAGIPYVHVAARRERARILGGAGSTARRGAGA
ncbi:hypothetical protein [Streptomyces sp. NPDC047973]|uniref:hypothetical protein n=1 Tax=Streptomyces sp. NPDC047973 TaxID=3155383 RepID=UPI00343B1BDF